MKFALFLEVDGIAIAIIVLLFHRTIANIKDYKARLFEYTCVGMFFLALSDIYWIAVDEHIITANQMFHAYFSNYCWYFSMCVSGCIYFAYTQNLFNLNYIKDKSKRWLLALPAAFGIVLTGTTYWNKLIFSISSEGIYSRGPLNWMIMGVMFIYLIAPAGQAIWLMGRRNMTYAEKHINRLPIYFALVPVLCGVIQFINPGVPLSTISGAFSMMILHTEMQYRFVETDNLTQLRNKNGLNKYIEKMIYSAKHSGGSDSVKQIVLILVDIKKLRKINSEFGQREGEEVIKSVAEILKSIAKEKKGFAARYKGGVFAYVFNAGYIGEVKDIESLIIKKLEEYYNHPYQRYSVTLNFGYAVYNAAMRSDVELLYEAAFNNLMQFKSGNDDFYRGGMIE